MNNLLIYTKLLILPSPQSQTLQSSVSGDFFLITISCIFYKSMYYCNTLSILWQWSIGHNGSLYEMKAKTNVLQSWETQHLMNLQRILVIDIVLRLLTTCSLDIHTKKLLSCGTKIIHDQFQAIEITRHRQSLSSPLSPIAKFMHFIFPKLPWPSMTLSHIFPHIRKTVFC